MRNRLIELLPRCPIESRYFLTFITSQIRMGCFKCESDCIIQISKRLTFNTDWSYINISISKDFYYYERP